RRPLVVPCKGKLYIFGGDNLGEHWVDIYTIRSGLWERREVPGSALLSRFSHQWLMWYDVNVNSWEEVDCKFPRAPEYHSRKLIRLGCNLLIVDSASVWYIYDLVRKKLLANVAVGGFDGSEIITDIFCCHHANEESLIYVFMEPDETVFKPEKSPHPQHVSYAIVKLKLQTFSAKVEYEGHRHLKVGPYIKHYM
ncbi:hypothetical protein PIB30_111874, partial [Stylosanthes scabra]|nr:hypothetical protein [Stylosanthes scabra]